VTGMVVAGAVLGVVLIPDYGTWVAAIGHLHEAH
jgi:hypothetical protein